MRLLRARTLRALATGLAAACTAGPAPGLTQALPPQVAQALLRANVPPEAMAVVVQEVNADEPLLAHQASLAVNPASLFKLVTTLAALDLLGPGFSWTTPVWLDGSVANGVLDGSLAIKGSGDPTLVPERLWLLLRRVQQLGVREIRGDIVLDRSAFATEPGAPADFDGEPLRPYNARPDALLLAHKAVIYGFVPDKARGVATVTVEPALHGHEVQASVPLVAGPCGDWRAQLKATPADPDRMAFGGGYPLACGERSWPLAYPDAAAYNARLLRAMWQGMGGTLGGQVREGSAPATPSSFEWLSPPLAEVVRDINKHSNNLMAQQLFLTLGQRLGGSGSAPAGREVLRRWLAERLPGHAAVIVNGSGLDRDQRVSATLLAGLLHWAWHSPWMPELAASLPITGLDGTLRRSRGAPGRAHLKTGSLRDVAAIGGYVLTPDGRWRIVVGVIHHPLAQAARPALDALVDWAADQPGGATRPAAHSPHATTPPRAASAPRRSGPRR